jgi:hypothetical protein
MDNYPRFILLLSYTSYRKMGPLIPIVVFVLPNSQSELFKIASLWHITRLQNNHRDYFYAGDGIPSADLITDLYTAFQPSGFIFVVTKFKSPHHVQNTQFRWLLLDMTNNRTTPHQYVMTVRHPKKILTSDAPLICEHIKHVIRVKECEGPACDDIKQSQLHFKRCLVKYKQLFNNINSSGGTYTPHENPPHEVVTLEQVSKIDKVLRRLLSAQVKKNQTLTQQTDNTDYYKTQVYRVDYCVLQHYADCLFSTYLATMGTDIDQKDSNLECTKRIGDGVNECLLYTLNSSVSDDKATQWTNWTQRWLFGKSSGLFISTLINEPCKQPMTIKEYVNMSNNEKPEGTKFYLVVQPQLKFIQNECKQIEGRPPLSILLSQGIVRLK